MEPKSWASYAFVFVFVVQLDLCLPDIIDAATFPSEVYVPLTSRQHPCLPNIPEGS